MSDQDDPYMRIFGVPGAKAHPTRPEPENALEEAVGLFHDNVLLRRALEGLAEALWSFISDADAQELHVGSLTSHQRDARAQARAALKQAAPFLKKETT